MKLKRLVIDVLTPREPGIITYAERLSAVDRIEGVSIRVIEQDDRTRTTEMVFEGEDIPFDELKKRIEGLGGPVHSVHKVAAGSRIIHFGTKGTESS